MLPLNLILLIDVTFSTPTPVNDSYQIRAGSICCRRYENERTSLAISSSSCSRRLHKQLRRACHIWHFATVDKRELQFYGRYASSGIGLRPHHRSALLALDVCPPANLGEPLPGVFRRFVTFWLDFILAMILITPIVGIFPALTEWKRTGTFQWHFERTLHAPGDGWLVAAGAILLIPGLVFYFAFPLIRRRPSPGACITGYQVVPDDGITMTVRTAILRTLLGFIAACAAYLAPFIARNRKKGKFWLDTVFGTRALRFR